MQFSVEDAKNGEKTLVLNGIALYSKYKPVADAAQWVMKEFNEKATHYLVVGLGLGYHVEVLATLTTKPIYVYYFSDQEKQIYLATNPMMLENIFLVNHLADIEVTAELQLLVPNAWLKAIGESHPLYAALDTIKRTQLSYKKFGSLMKVNADLNQNSEFSKEYPIPNYKTACLIASGPSLNTTIHWLKSKKEIDIYVVGSALKLALKHNIPITGVIISDAQDIVKNQLTTEYAGPLFYLLTANTKAVMSHVGKKYLLCQVGYEQAENLAKKQGLPLFRTGGSVSTTAFSLIEYLGYENLILFGQDMGFEKSTTHAIGSTSGKNVTTNLRVKANDGTWINTQPNLQVYHRWFNDACQQTSMQVYNTAQKGAAITNVPLITEEQFKGL